MPTWQKIIYILIVVGLIFLLSRTIRANPSWLSKENLSKSFGTMGVLALILIAFVGFCVLMLRH